MEDYYKILGIGRGASQDEIKRAYHKLAHKYHPDKSGGDEKKFKEINEAYQVLSDANKRKEYDRFGRVGGDPFSGGFQWGGGGEPFGWDVNFSGSEDFGDLKDIFDMFFEGANIRGKRRTYRRGADLELNVALTLEEVKSGKTIESKFKTFVECKTCSGVGHSPEKGFSECSRCNGTGEIKEEKKTFFGNFTQVVACRDCRGAGQIPKEICKDCKGAGRIMGERIAKFDIRPGVEDGQIIKVNKMGEAGEHQTEAGDLYVRVRVKPHQNFTRAGNDLHTKAEVSLTDILLGKQQKVKNVDGKTVEFNIPAGFNLSDEIRVRGEGLTKSGDLVISLEAKAPEKLSTKAKKLLQDLDKEI